MAEPFLGEIITVPYNFAPQGYLLCQGQLLPIEQYAALFSLLGTSFGGNGTSNFALPNLQGMIAVGSGQGSGLSFYELGHTYGVTEVTLDVQEIPAHSHRITGSFKPATTTSPVPASANVVTAPAETVRNVYGTPNKALAPGSVGSTGGPDPHSNMQPYLVLNFAIAIVGIFPPRG